MATIILSSSTIAENTVGPFQVGTLSITGGAEGETFTFTLEDDRFEIAKAEDGQPIVIVKEGTSFDFETGPRQFTINVQAVGSLNTAVDPASFQIDVTDVNEAPTDILMTGGAVPANAMPETEVATLQAEDPDEGEEFTYTFVTDQGGNTEDDPQLFEIVDNKIRVKGELTVGDHRLWVKVTDSGDPSLSYVKQITLTVTEANEPPEVSFDMADVVEGAKGGTIVGTLTVSDPEASGAVTYELIEIDGDGAERPSSLFVLDANGNVVVREGAQLRLVNGEYPSFIVKASDGPNTVYQPCEVVLGENQAPTVNFASELDLPKTLEGGTFLGTLMADDQEGDEVTYTPVDGSESLIRIDANGDVYVLDDAEITHALVKNGFKVEWSDGITTYTETYYLDFVNEAPVVTLTQVSILEGNPVSRVVGKLSATDPEGDALTYKLVGDNAALFDLVQTGAGYDIVLKPDILLDYEDPDPDLLSVDVEVPDDENTVRETLGIEIEDVNEAPVVTFAARRVNEGAKAGAVIGRLDGADPEDNDLHYTLSAASAKYFTLVENDAGGRDVVVRSGVILDYENVNHRSFSVTIKDDKNAVSSTFTLNLVDRIDVVTGTQSKNTLKGASGSDVIKGLGGDDTLIAYGGNDTLYGGLGRDTLSGGSGKDVFVFDAKPGRTNFDRVTDFDVKDDSIWLENKVFTKLGSAGSASKPAQLNKAFFAIDRAKDKNDYLIYNKTTGVLSYDADGSGFKSTAAEIAQLKKGLAMSYKDFFVI